MKENKKPPLGEVLSVQIRGKPARGGVEQKKEVDKIYQQVIKRRAELNHKRRLNKQFMGAVETYNEVMNLKLKGGVQKTNHFELD